MQTTARHRLIELKTITRNWILQAVCVFLAALLAVPAMAQEAPAVAAAPTIIKSIQVSGNQRVESNTVASYLLIAPGDPYSETRIDTSIKTLYATGLFADVAINPRDGNILIEVVENPIINRVILEGNKSLKTDKITDEIEAEPRSIFTALTFRRMCSVSSNYTASRGSFRSDSFTESCATASEPC